MSSIISRWLSDDMRGVRIIDDGNSEGEVFDLRPLDENGNPIDWDDVPDDPDPPIRPVFPDPKK